MKLQCLQGCFNLSGLDPFKHYDKAMNRRNVVLGAMKEEEMITEEEYTSAKNEKIILEEGGGSLY